MSERKSKPRTLDRIIQGWDKLDQTDRLNIGTLFDHCIRAHELQEEFDRHVEEFRQGKWQPSSDEDIVAPATMRNFLCWFGQIYIKREITSGPLKGADPELDDLLCSWRHLGELERKAVSHLAKEFAAEATKKPIKDDPFRGELDAMWGNLSNAQRGVLVGMAQDMIEGDRAATPKPEPKHPEDDPRVSFRKMANALIACQTLTDAELGKFLRVVREVVFSVK